MADLEIDLQGERVRLLPERALFRVRTGTLLIADAHWGKAASFRAAGLAVPAGTTVENLDRLMDAVKRTGAERVIFLGDLLHARSGRTPRTLAALRQWREEHAGLDILLVRGNHDRGAGDPPPELRIRCVDPPLIEPPFAYAHHPHPFPGAYTLAGHLHPAVRLAGPGRQRELLPCFWFGEGVGVLPAFGGFTGNAVVEPAPGDRVFVIAEDQVLPIA